MSAKFSWNGHKVEAAIRRRAVRAVTKTMADAVKHAKDSHPGWQNRTGTAEGSIQILHAADRQGDEIAGRWGSRNVGYFLQLELFHGGALRKAGDAQYPNLPRYLKG